MFTGRYWTSPRKLASLFIALLLALYGCSSRTGNSTPASQPAPAPTTALTQSSAPSQTPSQTSTPAFSATPVSSPTTTYTATPSPAASLTPTIVPSQTPTLTPSATITTTLALPLAEVQMQANCRYGPGTAYLYSHGLYPGDLAEVHGRNASSSWLWIKPENLERRCWAAASVLKVTGDPKSAPLVQTRLPHSSLYGPPEEVQAVRQGSLVVVAWSPVPMTADDYRGYLIEATLCQNGQRVSVAIHVDGVTYEFIDEGTCSGESGGRLYTVEKHGYSDPVTIPWP